MANVLTAVFDCTTVCVFIGALVLAWIFYPRKKYRLPPGPYNWPIVGCTFELMRSKYGMKQFLQYQEWAKKYGSMIRVKTVFGDTVLINEIKEVNEALVTKTLETAGRMDIYTIKLSTSGGKGITFSDWSDVVKNEKRIGGTALRNLLSKGQLQKMVHMSLPNVLNLFEDKANKNEAFDPMKLLSLIVYNIICTLCFNKSYDIDDEEFLALYEPISSIGLEFASGFFLADIFPPARYLPPTPAYKRILSAVDSFNEYISKEIREHEETLDGENVKDLVDHILQLEREGNQDDQGKGNAVKLDKVHYMEIIKDVFGAGTETTSISLNWLVFLLAKHQDVQRKVQEEIDDVVGFGRLPGNEDRSKMPYCEAVMMEAMRFGTVAPIGVPHRTMADVEIGGYEIPSDTIVIINQFALHWNPKEWKNPEQFNPNNFLDDEGKLLTKPHSFLPFGAGKRVCMGEAISKLEMFIIYTALFQKFNFVFEEGYEAPEGNDSYNDMSLSGKPKPYQVLAQLREST